MLTPFARRVISRILALNRASAFGAIVRLTSGLAAKLTQESRAFRLYDVSLGRPTAQTSHTHAVPTIVVLIAGTVMSDGPDTHAKANPGAPIGLKQLTEPGQWIFVPGGDKHHLVSLGTGGARVVEIEVS